MAKKLLLAAKKGDVGAIKEQLDAGIAVDTTDAGGSTPLYWACYKGHTGKWWPPAFLRRALQTLALHCVRRVCLCVRVPRLYPAPASPSHAHHSHIVALLLSPPRCPCSFNRCGDSPHAGKGGPQCAKW